MKNIIALVVGTVVASAVSVSLGQNLLVNPSFESPITTGWTVANAGNFSGVNTGGGTAHTGTGYFGMGATTLANQTDFYQDVTTLIGTTYSASFWAYDLDPAASGFIHVTFGGLDIGPISGSVPGTPYHQYTISFVATSTTTRFESKGWEASQYVISDDYDVHAVPAPASLALLGLGGLVAGRRRR
jgi:hypothetical protein